MLDIRKICNVVYYCKNNMQENTTMCDSNYGNIMELWSPLTKASSSSILHHVSSLRSPQPIKVSAILSLNSCSVPLSFPSFIRQCPLAESVTVSV